MKLISKLFYFSLLIIAVTNITSCSFSKKSFQILGEMAPSHAIWDELVKKHVRESGEVDYPGFIADSLRLNEYLQFLSDSAPHPNKWTEAERLAYWINAYNAFTIQIVIRHYPVNGIKEIATGLNIPFVSTTWDINFIQIGGEKINLNRIEHGIIRKEFNEPRIHFAVNCASVSCPKLRNEAYTADRLEMQLEDQTRTFINNQEKNIIISPDQAEVSKLFSWFSGDFKKKVPSVIDFINQYSQIKLHKNAKLNYLEYNWALNDAAQ
jgi:hypothetical protein